MISKIKLLVLFLNGQNVEARGTEISTSSLTSAKFVEICKGNVCTPTIVFQMIRGKLMDKASVLKP